ncbi:sugar ABC transporter permease [Kiloniella litopenaei]|uniref:Sugar ABC transporter permease n=1 Tax=Kiloniella litopenaei TaxID=1549748 RepID=A0A0M2RDI0_9PROT|nr:ABC transporter permease [Kiloniella litopenaei]KKJ77618.1 sugar ABC transporter permease [Kiloniella litopenaei]
MSSPSKALPAWIDVGLIPLINILLAFIVSGIVIFIIGEDPVEAVKIIVYGAFGNDYNLGYTLYYTTNFIFTGLAVAVAFHASLFNIGGEGQAYIGGLGVGLLCLALDQYFPFWIILPLAIAASGLFGAAWAYIPAYLQAYRGSHIVITTIMFNFIAFSLMNYLLVNILIEPGQMSPESRDFAEVAHIPTMQQAAAWFGIEMSNTPLNMSIFLALLSCVFVWLFMWHTRWGYAIRMLGFNENAANYSGINTQRLIVGTMCLSGVLAGFVGINEIMGVHHRVLLDFTAGAGFTGIAVALMGRNHPVGIIIASLLFGALFQGGAELSFEIPTIQVEMVKAIQGLVILFCGALAYMARPTVERIFIAMIANKAVAGEQANG